MKIRALGNRVDVHDAPPMVLRELQTRLTLPNPRYVGAVRAGKVPIGIDKVIRYYSGVSLENRITIPAACAGLATAAAKRAGVRFSLTAENRLLEPAGLSFRGVLRLYQIGAVAELARFAHGVLDLGTGGGKTVMGCARIAEVDQPALVIVPNKTIQGQWVAAVGKFLNLPTHEITLIGGGRQAVHIPHRMQRYPLTIAIINSLRDCAEELAPHVGHLVVDECHRVVGRRYWETCEHFDCKWRTGLSATVSRRDGLGDAIPWALGRVVKVDRSSVVRAGFILPADVEQRATQFTSDINFSDFYSDGVRELVHDRERNEQIAADVRGTQGINVIMCGQKEHCDLLAPMIPGSTVLHGGLRAAPRREAEAAIGEGRARVIIATIDLLGEGWDYPAAQTMFLASPIKWSGRLLQVIGRMLRPFEGQTHGKIIDYCDWLVGVLANGARARAKVYKQLARDERGERSIDVEQNNARSGQGSFGFDAVRRVRSPGG